MGELRELTGHQVVDVLRERYAGTSRQRAALLAAVWETVLCADPDSTDRMDDRDEWSADEVRAGLGLTRRAATLLVDEAYAVVERLPKLHEAIRRAATTRAGARAPARPRRRSTTLLRQRVGQADLPRLRPSGPGTRRPRRTPGNRRSWPGPG